MTESGINSILAADFGSVNTRALLIDQVDGEYRLVGQATGRTTIGASADDAHTGLAAVLRTMSESTGRRFLDETGHLIRPEQSDRIGVDYFLTTTSAGQPLRAVLIGLYPQVSIAAARRAIAPFYIDAVAKIHLEDGLGAKGRLNRIIHSRPQLIFIAGGTDGGARAVLLEMLALAREAVSLMPQSNRPAVVYAGNSSLATSAREMLSQQAEVLIAPNIRQ
ncbi:MAG: glutamate mutase L, partial [Chloroflexi bacterium]|nr:glutamate mutase L [Chloroflexota bacterium]